VNLRRIALASLGAVSAACSIFVSYEGFTDGLVGDGGKLQTDAPADTRAPDSRDAMARDSSDTQTGDTGATAADAADAALEVLGPNLHSSGSFEDGCKLPWDAYNGTLAPSTTAHSGGKSCRVCVKSTVAPDDTFAADDNRASGAASVGARYRASAWVRADDSAPALPIALLLRAATSTRYYELTEGPKTALDLQWRRLEVTLTVTSANTFPNVVIDGRANPSSNNCFLLDDVEVRQIQ
jgi:hypothetical protein